MPSKHPDSDDLLNELAGLLAPLLEATCPVGGGGFGGCLHADLSISTAVEAGLDAKLVRTAASRAGERSAGGSRPVCAVTTSSFGTVANRRPPFAQILEADMQRRTRKAVLAVGNGAPVPAPNMYTTSAALAAIIDPWYSAVQDRTAISS